MKTESCWNAEQKPEFKSLNKNIQVDVAIIGAGITGLITACLLHEHGVNAAVFEKGTVGQGESHHTTAHLTYVTDERLSKLSDHFGKSHAAAIWDGGKAAIETIHEKMHKYGIDCGFTWVPGYFHASLEKSESGKLSEFESDFKLASDNGFEVSSLDTVPVVNKAGLRFADQAKFHPIKFLYGLAAALKENGLKIYENSELTEIDGEKNELTINNQKVVAKKIVFATHIPLQGKLSAARAALFQTKLYPYTSYVVRAELADSSIPEALFWDTTDPYYYLRIDKEDSKKYAIFGGRDCKTGQESNPDENFKAVESKLKETLEVKEITHRWAGQVVETNDGIPFIGEIDDGQFVATGYAGNGFTFGTLAGMIIADQISGRKNPWYGLFDPERMKIRGGLWDYISENADYPYFMVKKLFMRGSKQGPESLARGEGTLLKINQKTVAACRDTNGNLHLLSPECTHMGCYIKWNNSLQSWDCPCHGSRFSPEGKVIGGPAERNLDPFKPKAEAVGNA